MNFDITTWAGISAATLIVVSSLKIVARKIITGHEEVAAGLVGLVLGIAALTSHAMTFQPGIYGWIQAVVGGITAGAAAGVGHDKLLNPVMNSLFASKAPKTYGPTTTAGPNGGTLNGDDGGKDGGE